MGVIVAAQSKPLDQQPGLDAAVTLQAMADAPTRDEVLDRLLSVPLDRFVEERNGAARELRSAGDREMAAWVASLRRPTPAVWALDQVARTEPQRVGWLLDLGGELRTVQGRAVRGDREAAARMQDLGRQVQRAVDDTVRRATELLRDAGHGASTDTAFAMASTLRAALAGSDELREQLAAGRLLAPESVPGFGFDGVDLPDAPVVADAADPAREGDTKAHPRTRSAHADANAAAARQHATDAAHAADEADREVFRRQREAESAQQAVNDVRIRMRALEEELSTAEERARTATQGVRDAVQLAREARRNADKAQAALSDD
jgi:hypothetical protein